QSVIAGCPLPDALGILHTRRADRVRKPCVRAGVNVPCLFTLPVSARREPALHTFSCEGGRMKKLRMALDQLTVETLDVEKVPEEKGTVHGHASLYMWCQYTYDRYNI